MLRLNLLLALGLVSLSSCTWWKDIPGAPIVPHCDIRSENTLRCFDENSQQFFNVPIPEAAQKKYICRLGDDDRKLAMWCASQAQCCSEK